MPTVGKHVCAHTGCVNTHCLNIRADISGTVCVRARACVRAGVRECIRAYAFLNWKLIKR